MPCRAPAAAPAAERLARVVEYTFTILEVTGPTRRITGATLALALLLVWAGGLRVWLAAPGLDRGRFWDERYGVENVCSLLLDGQLRPANGFHPGLSYLPHAALLAASAGLHRLSGSAVFAVFSGSDDLSPTGYFLCRLLQVLAAILSLYLAYRIGRRLESPAAGLIAALLLAAVPWHLRQSVIFKPDSLLVAATLAAFAASLAAADRPTRRGLVVAGAVAPDRDPARGRRACRRRLAQPATMGRSAAGGDRGRRRLPALHPLPGVAAGDLRFEPGHHHP